MSDIKCPFCGEKIEHIKDGWCNCKNRCTGSGSIELWLQFLRTRKALEIAFDGLEKMTWGCDSSDAENLLKEIKEITALTKGGDNE